MMKWTWVLRSLLLYLLCALGSADELEVEVESGLMLRMLRDLANQTASDSLNLPANATSIRENITDTFSCENRTYGYYADVDNDCQIFHVCLPTQTARGRNVTYRWSFICPSETIFNQEYLTCTRPKDAIDCKDSPDYYDVNQEIGKDYTRIVEEEENITNTIEVPIKENKKEVYNKKEQDIPSRNPVKRKPAKQNYIIQQLIKDIVEEEMNNKIQGLEQEEVDIFPVISDNEPKDIENRDRIIIPDKFVEAPFAITQNEPNTIVNRDRIVLPNDKADIIRKEFIDKRENVMEEYERDDDRLALERSMRRNQRGRNARGGIKFFRDV